MKRIFRAGIVCLVAAAVFAGIFPATVLAANNEPVLTSIYHSSAVAAVNITGATAVTLRVPYTHTGSVNLAQGLDVSFNTSTYAFAVPDFPNGSIAVVDGDPVDMVVTYQRKGDATLFTTTYSVKVVRAAYVAPTFTGTIEKTVTLSKALTFTLADFADKYVKNNGGDLGSIEISGSNPSFGTLRLGTSPYTTGTLVTATDLKNGRLTFAATSSGTVTYIVRAYAAGDTQNPIGSVFLTIKAQHVAPTFTGTISKTVEVSSSLTLTLSDFSSRYTKNDGGDLASITITGSNTSVGRLQLGGSNYSSGSTITVSDLSSGRLRFAATGTGTASYTVRAYAAGNPTTAIGAVSLKIAVDQSSAGVITYATAEGGKVEFDAYDFDMACEDLTGEALYYVRFTLPSSTYGKLYYDYVSADDYDSLVSSSTRYYVDDLPDLSKVSFVPRAGFDGTLTIKYTGYNFDGETYTGNVRIVIKDTSDADDIVYETSNNTPVTFDAADFNDVCRDLTGENLSYVRFDLPSASYGRLFYDYESPTDYDSAVTASGKYYRVNSPYLSEVTFVPKASYSGTITIDYTGYNTDGDSYLGSITILVRESAGDISYSITRGGKVGFDSVLFNEVCDDLTGYNLSYVRFTLPSSSYGTLYYGYTSPTNTGTKVSSSTRYYRNSSPYLSNVVFVPNASYTGTVSISYTGFNTRGESYSGVIKVAVRDYQGSQYFGDIEKSYWWCSEAVDYLYKRGIAGGIGGNSYGPSLNIKRADFIVMLCRAFGLQAYTSSNFIDVAQTQYYYDEVATAKALGIAQGDGQRFRPEEALTRQEAMALVIRALEHVSDIELPAGTASDLLPFSDRGQIETYARDAASSLVRAGVIQGSGGKLNPRGNITRAEMAVILHRLLTLR
jgi:hypothetical protein